MNGAFVSFMLRHLECVGGGMYTCVSLYWVSGEWTASKDCVRRGRSGERRVIDVLWEKDEGKRREFFRMGREWSLEGGREGGRKGECV